MGKEKKAISLATYVVSLLIMLAIIVGLVFVLVRGDSNKETKGNEIENTSTDNNGVNEGIIKMAKATYEKYLSIEIYMENNIGAMPYILKELELEDEKSIEKTLEENPTNDTTTYIKSNTKYEDFKNELLKYMTETKFENDFKHYKNMNGYVGFQNVSVGGWGTFYIQDLELISKENNKYKFNITIIDEQVYNNYIEENIEITEENKKAFTFNDVVILEYNNGNLVIAETHVDQCEEENNDKDEFIVLHNGTELKKDVGIQYLGYGFMEFTKENKKKYNREYYNYEKNEYKGKTQGIFGEDQFVENVSDFAISKKYDAIPRKFTKVEKLPEQLNDMMDLNNVEIEAIDLDGDGKDEYIVGVQHTTLKGDYDVDKNSAYSEIYLFNSNYNKIASLASWTNNFEDESEAGYLDIENVMYLDIDNDGVMEIILEFPLYEGGGISILKYSNNKLEGKTDLEVNPVP